MITSNAGKNLIKQFEALHLDAYLDPVGIPTIGWGTIRINGQKVRMGMKCTAAQAEEWFATDLAYFENVIRDAVKVPLTQRQFDALVSFVYNLGGPNFRKSTLLRLINQGNFAAAQPQFLRWNRAGGKVLRGLTRRRLAEAVLFGPASSEELVAIYKPVV